jgi:hypothetical protein
VAKLIIHALEAIEIDKKDRELLLGMPQNGGDSTFKKRKEVGAVG